MHAVWACTAAGDEHACHTSQPANSQPAPPTSVQDGPLHFSQPAHILPPHARDLGSACRGEGVNGQGCVGDASGWDR